jgi:hypothetical protein
MAMMFATRESVLRAAAAYRDGPEFEGPDIVEPGYLKMGLFVPLDSSSTKGEALV